ncbi:MULTISPECIES: lipid-A-disaccharide synthase [Spirulina sp. CCY15215]|uniref:lipid-A-disaccharide synthase n=1 Tax=Spirulina sp. CCY15215 TaxID=2767591 RepID=UPI00195266FD|nr:lipid-A-disaccharide synthase [Spirulina major]
MENDLEAIDILILSNGPGEIATWVRPVVQALREQLGEDRNRVRISVILSPCPHSTGRETEIVRSYPQVDRVQSSEHFWQFLLWGKTAENWHWHKQGVVLFLGGDRIFPVIIGKRLNYRIVVYAEWSIQWERWVDRFGVMKQEVCDRVPQKYQHKCSVVGDLMIDISPIKIQNNEELIGLMPGSKAMKLTQGLPLMCGIAESLHRLRPQIRFVLPVAPTLTLKELAKFGDRAFNPVIAKIGNVAAELVFRENNQPYLRTSGGVEIELWQPFPAHEILSQCRLCATTIGANTAQLTALGVPMLVLLPTQQFDAMRAWDGVPGILANLPLLGTPFTYTINWLMRYYVFRINKLFAWPNIWAKREIVPEIIGDLEPNEIAKIMLDWLEHPEKLKEMQESLQQVRGESGAARKLAELVGQEIAKPIDN